MAYQNHYKISGGSLAILAQFLLEHSSKGNNDIILIVPSHKDIVKYRDILTFFHAPLPLICFPPFDILPFDRISPSGTVMAARISAVKQIDYYQSKKQPFILITTPSGLLQKIRHVDVLKKSSVSAAVNKKVPIDKLSRFLSLNGYVRTPTVREQGEFSVRGGIVDIFPSSLEQPIRIDFFGDVIDKIKLFDPVTQRSTDEIDSFDLSPALEIILNKQTISDFKKAYRLLHDGDIPSKDPLYEKISQGSPMQGMESYLPLFDSNLTDLTKILPKADIVLDPYAPAIFEGFITEIYDYYLHRSAHQKILTPDQLYHIPFDGDDLIHKALAQRSSPNLPLLDWKEILSALLLSHKIYSSSLHILPPEKNVINLQAKPLPSFSAMRKLPHINLFDATIKELKKAQKTYDKIIITAPSDGIKQRLQESFEEHNLKNTADIDHFSEVIEGKINFIVSPLSEGFIRNDIFCLTQEDIFGQKARRRKTNNKQSGRMILETQCFLQNDYIVHADHGIGIYKGLETLTVERTSHDCVLLEYFSGDKLYIPVENIDLLTRYGAAGSGAVLDKLGSAAWQSRKAKLKEKLTDIADYLIQIAAERQLRRGEIIVPIEDLYQDFCARFPYEETEDQLNAIHAVTQDMASGRPMDRLICGDVGFGKTEVAIRAAFLAAAAGKQTAIIVPTTLLARQHFKHFKERFENQPFKVACLSRMISTKQAAQTRSDLKDGKVDIIIGTHALLSNSVKFKDLGLLIIDEEQHFGVTHKEKLKNLKSNLHILTLTATPIPRTLQLSMTGVRDLSIIATPPMDRLAIRTYISVFEKDFIREALLREKYRGGQSFFVVPRIADLEKMAAFLTDHVPEISFNMAHGKLPPAQMDQIMNDFYDQKVDILLATTIIESGIDVPTANTMIIWRADMFGLAQLYQIRGRIGRSKQRSYAYLTTQKGFMTKTAEKRLKVLESLDHLGAGFTLASHDMDIRGAGNLLGSQQSGHIKEVGFELYQQMLDEALATLKQGGEDVLLEDNNNSPQINIGLSARIPEEYVQDLDIRFGLYRHLANINNREEIDNFAAELIDRFGDLPSEVKNLLSVIELKCLAKKAYISKVDAGDKGLLLAFYKDHFPYPAKLLAWMDGKKGTCKIRSDHRLNVNMNIPTIMDKFKASVKILKQIGKICDEKS